MSVFDEVHARSQPGYEASVATLLGRLRARLGDAAFHGVEADDFLDHCLTALEDAAMDPDIVVQSLSDLVSLNWWCGLELSDQAAGVMGRLARATQYRAAQVVTNRMDRASPAALRAHAVFAGTFVSRGHSPTAGAFDYARALAADPDNERIEVYHQGGMTPDLEAFARERLGELSGKVRFVSTKDDPNFLVKALSQGPRTFHIWCEPALAPHISLVALFGPTLMFTCGDVAPIQFADVYWYCQDADYMAGLWRRRGAPESFIANYRQSESVSFLRLEAKTSRTRADLGFGLDEVVIVSVGNRIAIDLDQTFVDGMGALLLANPSLRWVIVGGLPEFWINAFQTVLGDQFSHIPFDDDLSGLFKLTDIFANPFRAGGGNSALYAMDAGTVVMTRDDMGDIRAFTPPQHRAPDAASYFDTLAQLAADSALRAAWLAEQQSLLARRADLDHFAGELKAMNAIAYERFCARLPVRLEGIYAQEAERPGKLRRDRGRRVRLR